LAASERFLKYNVKNGCDEKRKKEQLDQMNVFEEVVAQINAKRLEKFGYEQNE
jgi:hypothetical protein